MTELSSVNVDGRLLGRDLPEQPVGTTLTLTCPGCGKPFQWTSEEGYERPLTYCRKRCRNNGRRINARTNRFRTDSPLPEDETDLRLLVCSVCEDPFGWLPTADSTDAAPLYCSTKCTARAKRLREMVRLDAADPGRIQRRAELAASELAAQQRRANRAVRAGRISEAAELRRELERRSHEADRQQHDIEAAPLIAAASEAARFLLLPAGRCTTCGKVANPTEAAAKDAKRAIEKRAGRTNEVRYYQCNDGWWHWTRMEATLDGFRAHQAERLMTESPASLRHRGRGVWSHLGETR